MEKCKVLYHEGINSFEGASAATLGDNSLLEACFEGHYAVAEFLVQKRASVNKANERGITGRLIC